MRRWPQWRLGDEHHGLFQADVGHRRPEPRQRRSPAPRPGARRDASRALPGDAAAGRRRRGRGRDLADGTVHRAGHVVLAADAWTNELLALVRSPAASDDHPGAGHLLRAARSRGRSPRIASRSGSGWTTRRFYGFPTYGEAGPEGRRRTSAATRSRRRPGRSIANEVAFARLTDVPRAPPAGAPRAGDLTKTCLYTLTPDRDFVLDRLPGPAERPRRARRRPRVQVRLGASAGSSRSWSRTARPRRPARSSASGSTGPSSSRRTPPRASWYEVSMSTAADTADAPASRPPARGRHRRDRRAGQHAGRTAASCSAASPVSRPGA